MITTRLMGPAGNLPLPGPGCGLGLGRGFGDGFGGGFGLGFGEGFGLGLGLGFGDGLGLGRGADFRGRLGLGFKRRFFNAIQGLRQGSENWLLSKSVIHHQRGPLYRVWGHAVSMDFSRVGPEHTTRARGKTVGAYRTNPMQSL